VVDLARRALKERRIGHTGTLDPMAEGLLLLCVGHATRLQQYLLEWDKSYAGRIRLGRSTTTYDREGEPTDERQEPPTLNETGLAEIAARFHGSFEQLPPPFSAKKIDGKRLYELARQGEAVDVEPKTVMVHSIDLKPDPEPGFLAFELTCSSGFYVRSMAHDIGQALGCGAHLHHLERRSIGPYAVSSAISQAELEAATTPEAVVEDPRWISLDAIKLPFPQLALNPSATDRFTNGQEVVVLRVGDTDLGSGGLATVTSQQGRLLGIGEITQVLARGRTVAMRPKMVLSRSA
jgi:tRNA pseudouridine55 synthase